MNVAVAEVTVICVMHYFFVFSLIHFAGKSSS